MDFELVTERLNSGVVVALEAPSCEENNILERIMDEVAYGLGLETVHTWDLALGFQKVAFTPGVGIKLLPPALKGWEKGTAHDALRFIRTYEGNGIFIFIDFHKLMPDVMVQRLLKATCSAIYSEDDNLKAKRVILLGENLALPRDFDGWVSKVRVPLPTAAEILEELRLQAAIFQEKEDYFQVPNSDSDWMEIVRKAGGLSRREITNIVREVAGACHEIGTETAQRLHQYKVQKLAELGVEVAEAPDSEIGGMSNVKRFIQSRSAAIIGSNKAIPRIKGILAVGHPGTGKSLMAKSIGQTLGVPVFKLQMDALFGSLVGQSEQNTRKILEMATASAPIVLWIDEIEKAFAGMSGDASVGDSGVGRRVFGLILTWMQENREPVFVVATANDVRHLPPELLRKGRFSEIFRVDLPTEAERCSILEIHLALWASNTEPEQRAKLAAALAKVTNDFSGAELAAVVEAAAIEAGAAGRIGAITWDDLSGVCLDVIPLAQQQKEKLGQLEESWNRFTPASGRPESSDSNSPAVSLSRSGVNSVRRKQAEKG